ncbi:MAG: GntG family PLP-dependent aldolase [Pirellulaceae bacterium]
MDSLPPIQIDLRSDTVTRPTPAMREAMSAAEVGDAVIDTDPTVDRLERKIARMLGKEAAVFMPSGTMTNQIAVRIHCKPGDEFLCEENCHIFNYEQGAFAQLSGVVARTIAGDHGVIDPDQLVGKARMGGDHTVHTRLLCLENTHNRAAGRVQPIDNVRKLCGWAHEHGMRTHLDGARLFNAVVAAGVAAEQWCQPFDTVSVCFSKGLGAPVGSALVGPAPMMEEARRHRKLFGGGMRQAGILAAGAIYALDHHLERLAEDHQLAQRLADGLARIPGIRLHGDVIESNMVIFHVNERFGAAQDVIQFLRRQQIGALAISTQAIRLVTHLDVSSSDCDAAISAIEQFSAQKRV